MNPLHPIHIEVHSVDRLLDRAGSVLVCPGIHPEVARAIRVQAAERRRHQGFQIEIMVPVEDLERGMEVETAVREHFSEEMLDAKRELQLVARKGWRSFALAFLLVAALLVFSELVLFNELARISSVLSHSLVIVAWVILWSPTETLLVSRIPLRENRVLAHALSLAPVVLKERQAVSDRDDPD